MRRLAVVAVLALAALAAAPGVAAADVIFDPADADELVVTLADANEAQDVCYGWSIDVDNEGVLETSVGSHLGAGTPVSEASGCAASVEFRASIIWTSESSESEDSASHEVVSSPGGPTTDDLDSLEVMSDDGLVGDNVDVDVYKAVAALPLLAADTGLAPPMEASPAPPADAGDAAPTDSPGSDFWRESGMTLLWAVLILFAAVAFGWYAISSDRRARRRPVGPVAEQLPAYAPEHVPPEWTDEHHEAPAAAEPPPEEPPADEPAAPEEPTRAEPASEEPPADEPDKPPTKPDSDTRPEG
ncbi:MAG: hypothetical protein ACRDSK_28670 [Actinophytocola sp.]|uniref:hypothetical protein n=1 Tax=Actinophytocola sp. TaxID=1872138 RepID=UPI003D6BBD72